MEQRLMTQGDKGINQDKSAFIPFSTSGSREGDKGINLFRVYPVSPLRIAGVWK
jgi:hypothetical protein